MEYIRWVLLLIGLLLVIGVYAVSRLQARESESHLRHEQMGRLRSNSAGDPAADDFDDIMDAELDQMGRLIADAADPLQDHTVTNINRTATTAPASETVFSVFVTAPTGVPFRGPILLGALAAAKLEFGEMQIFHRLEIIDGQEKVLFSAANIHEPGVFDLSAMDSFTTEGIVLFMQIPGAADAGQAFDAMAESAKVLADKLDGHVCDASRSALTQQTIRHMREEVISCQLHQRVANTAS
jgi:hypothetical protein